MVKVKPHLADKILFRKINLMDERYPIKESAVCRVLPQRVTDFDRSESLQWVEHPFQSMAPTVCRAVRSLYSREP